MRAASVIILCLGLIPTAHGATWQLSAGPTRADGSALEVSRSTTRWELALGSVSAQQVRIRTLQDTCIAGVAGPSCVTLESTTKKSVESYGYLSIQRKFTFRDQASLRPVLGFGIVANSDTNAYVSSAVAVSLSVGVRIGDRWSVEWRHFSNAGLAQPNLGQDILLVHAAFRGRDP